MLRYFRIIRKKLIEQVNVRKYILYAIGEILLVVIGILIALQVNNWNEQRKVDNEEQAILARLLEDLEFAKIQMLESIIGDRLSVHQTRIDNIVEYELNYLPMLAADKNLITIHPGEANNYIQIMQKPNVRNLLGIKLDLTILVLNLRESLDQELAQVIEMVQSEIN